MSQHITTAFIDYLQTELALSPESIELAMRQQSIYAGPLHIILWQHGLITLEQVAQIFEYLEENPECAQRLEQQACEPLESVVEPEITLDSHARLEIEVAA